MKRILIAILLFAAVVLSACTNTAQQVSKDTTASLKIGEFKQEDLVFVIENKKFPLNTDVASLLEAFGTEYTLTTAPSCVYDGEDKEFAYSFVVIFTYPLEGKDLIDEIYITDSNYETSKGIKIGSTLEEIKKQYGSLGFNVDSSYVYVLSGDINDLKSPKLYFDIADEKVIGFSYYAASNIAE